MNGKSRCLRRYKDWRIYRKKWRKGEEWGRGGGGCAQGGRDRGRASISHLPKSASFRSPCWLMSRFWGLRSLCRTRRLWQYARPRRIWKRNIWRTATSSSPVYTVCNASSHMCFTLQGVSNILSLFTGYIRNKMQYNTISFNGTKNTPADTDATEDYTRKKS